MRAIRKWNLSKTSLFAQHQVESGTSTLLAFHIHLNLFTAYQTPRANSTHAQHKHRDIHTAVTCIKGFRTLICHSTKCPGNSNCFKTAHFKQPAVDRLTSPPPHYYNLPVTTTCRPHPTTYHAQHKTKQQHGSIRFGATARDGL